MFNRVYTNLDKVPNGAVLRYKRKLYFVSNGLDDRIVTRHDTGQWKFIKDLNWKRFTMVYWPVT